MLNVLEVEDDSVALRKHQIYEISLGIDHIFLERAAELLALANMLTVLGLRVFNSMFVH